MCNRWLAYILVKGTHMFYKEASFANLLIRQKTFCIVCFLLIKSYFRLSSMVLIINHTHILNNDLLRKKIDIVKGLHPPIEFPS